MFWKRTVSLLLCLVLLLGMAPAVSAAEETGEDDGPTMQSAIVDAVMDDTTAAVTIAAAEDGYLAVAMYTEKGRMIGVGLEPVAAVQSLTEVAVPLLMLASKPAYFELRVFLLDGFFAPQCSSYTSLAYTEAYGEFLAKTVEDFSGQTVLQVSEETDNNFMVLADGVICLTAPEDFETLQISEDSSVYSLNQPGEDAASVQSGDRVVLLDQDGISHSLKVAEVQSGTDTLVLTCAEEVQLSEMMDYIKLDLELDMSDYSDYAEYGEGVTDLAAPAAYTLGTGDDSELVTENRFQLGLSRELMDGLEISGNFDIHSQNRITVHYAAGGFTSEYYAQKVVNVMEASFDAMLKGSVNLIGDDESFEIPLIGFRDVPLGPTGLLGNLYFSIPLQAVVSGSIGVQTRVNYTSVTLRDPNGKDQSFQEMKTAENGVETEVEAKLRIGVRLTAELSFLKILSVSVKPEIGLRMTGVPDDTVLNITANPRHMCLLCVDGDVIPYAGVVVAGKMKAGKWSLTLFALSREVRLEKNNFYVGHHADDTWHFGWGDCPNLQYRIQVDVYDTEGAYLKGAMVEVISLEGPGYWNGTCGSVFYLPAGEYSATASCDGYANDYTDFTVGSGTETVTVTLAEEGVADDGGAKVIPQNLCWEYAYAFHVTLYTNGVMVIQDEHPEDFDGYCTSYSMVNPSGAFKLNDAMYRGSVRHLVFADSCTGTRDLQEAFRSMPSLQTVSLYPTMKTLGTNMLCWNPNLHTIIGSESVEVVSQSALAGTGLTEVNFPNTTRIGMEAFAQCKQLRKATLAGTLGGSALRWCTSLTSADLQDVTSIGSTAFEGCTSLQTLILGENLTHIGNAAFQDCASLQHIIIPNSVTGELDAFDRCSGLEYASIGSGVTTLGGFEDCIALKRVDIKGAETILYAAFQDCYSLETVYLPASLTSIDSYAFDNCPAIKDVYFAGTQEQWEAIEIGAYNLYLTEAEIHFESGLPG